MIRIMYNTIIVIERIIILAKIIKMRHILNFLTLFIFSDSFWIIII